MCARDLLQDLERWRLSGDKPERDATEDDLDYAVVDRVYGVAPDSRRQARPTAGEAES